MTSRMSVDDLELVDATARHGSLGAAAKELLVAQPSASRRLATLERRLGVELFTRDTTGARTTPAGRELARQAAQLLAELDDLPHEVLAAVDAPTLALGTIQALSPMVFAAAEIELAHVRLLPEIEHGPVLIQQVQHGVLDAAIITIAEQSPTPRGLQRTPLGASPLVVVLPDGAAELDQGARPVGGRTVFYSVIDLAGSVLSRRLSGMGAMPRRGATLEATLRVARYRRCPALLPEFAARWYAADGDRIVPVTIPGQVQLSLVSRPPQPSPLTGALPQITERILGPS